MIPTIERGRLDILGNERLIPIEHLKGCGFLFGNNRLSGRISYVNDAIKHGQFRLGAREFQPHMRCRIEIQLAHAEDQFKMSRRRLAALRFQQADVRGSLNDMHRRGGSAARVALKYRKFDPRIRRQPQRAVVFKFNLRDAHTSANLILLDDRQVGNGRLEPAPAAAVNLHRALYLAKADDAYFGAAGICIRCVIRLRERC